MKKYIFNRVTKDSSGYVFESLLPRFGTFLILPFVFRLVEPFIWAEIAIMIALSEILAKIYLFGSQSSIYRFGSVFSNEVRSHIFYFLIRRMFIVSMVTLALFEIFGFLYWGKVFDFEYGLPSRIAIAISSINALSTFITQQVKTLQEPIILSKSSVIQFLLTSTLQISLIAYISTQFNSADRMSVTAYLLGYSIGLLARTLYCVTKIKLKPIKSSSISTPLDLEKFNNFAKPAALLSFASVIGTYGVRFILEETIGLVELGKFTAYMSYIGLIFVIASSVEQYLFPLLFKKKADVKQGYKLKRNLLIVWTLFGIIFFNFFTTLDQYLFPQSYLLADRIIFILVISQVASLARTVSGIQFEVNEEMYKKFSIFFICTLSYLIYLGFTDNILGVAIGMWCYHLITSILYLVFQKDSLIQHSEVCLLTFISSN